jgi:hypothetical protein
MAPAFLYPNLALAMRRDVFAIRVVVPDVFIAAVTFMALTVLGALLISARLCGARPDLSGTGSYPAQRIPRWRIVIGLVIALAVWATLIWFSVYKNAESGELAVG